MTTVTTSPSSPSSTPLTDRVGFLVSQHAAARFAERLRPLGLHPRHFGLLSQLAAADGQTQQRLAAAMAIHRNVMVGLLEDRELPPTRLAAATPRLTRRACARCAPGLAQV